MAVLSVIDKTSSGVEVEFFMPVLSIIGTLLTHEDETEENVFLFNTLPDSQNGIPPSNQDAPPSFEEVMQDSTNERPPQYTEIAKNT